MDDEIVDAVNKGASPGDSVPAPRVHPLMSAFTDVDVRTAGSGDDEHLVMTFSVEGWEGRFGYEFSRDGVWYELADLDLFIDEGAIRDENRRSVPDQDGCCGWMSTDEPPSQDWNQPSRNERGRCIQLSTPERTLGQIDTSAPRKAFDVGTWQQSFRWRWRQTGGSRARTNAPMRASRTETSMRSDRLR